MIRALGAPADVDKLDYLLRDAFFTGLPFSLLDVKHLAASTSICKEHHADHLIVEPRAIHTLQRFMASREHLRPTIEYHKTTRAAESAALYSIIMVTRALRGDSPKFVQALDLMEDRDLEEVMHLVFEEGVCSEASILEQLRYRHLPSELETIDYYTYLTRFQSEFRGTPLAWAKVKGNSFLLDLPQHRAYSAKYLAPIFVREKGACMRLDSYFTRRSGREIGKYLEGLSRASWVGRLFSLGNGVSTTLQVYRSLRRQTFRDLTEIRRLAKSALSTER